MERTHLPPLPPQVTFLGSPSGPTIETERSGDANIQVITARYRVHGLDVTIGWTVGLPMGVFREPDKLSVAFDYVTYGHASAEQESTDFRDAFKGITSSFLRAIPIGHARALMRSTHERLLLAQVKEQYFPLPAKVNLDCEYAHVAAAYVALCESRAAQPIQQLKEWTSESADAWSARLRRARSKGILRGKGLEASLAPQYWPLVEQSRAALRTQEKHRDGDQ